MFHRTVKEIFRRTLRTCGYELKKLSRPNGRTRPVHFPHIGKNAGTQISELAEQIEAHDNNLRIIQHNHDVFLKDIPEEEAFFFSNRNPITRFSSGFYSRKRKGQPRLHSEWSIYDEKAFADFEHANDLAEALFADGELGFKALGSIKSIRHTAQNQTDWFYCCGNFLSERPPIWIIRQEKFEDDFASLIRKLGVTGELRIEQDPVKSHRGDYSDLPPLSQKAIVNLEAWYAQDFEFYKACEHWMTEHTD